MATIANLLVKIQADSSGLMRAVAKGKSTVNSFATGAKKNLTGVTKGFGQATRAATRFASKAGKGLGDLTRKFSLARKASSSLKTQLVGLVGVAAGLAALKSIFNVGREFSGAVADLSAITGATGEDLKFLTNAAKEFGVQTTLSATQAAEAFKLIASAKPDLLDNVVALKKVTKSAITLAEATGTTLADAANTLGASLNQFSAGASDADKFINIMAAGARLGSTEVGDVAIALKEAGLQAANAGLTFEEANAALQTLAKGTVKGAKAGTALRNILLSLETQTDRNLTPSIVGFGRALDNLADKNLGVTETVKLFQRENVTAVATLIKFREVYAGLLPKITGTTEAYEQAATKAGSFDGKMKTLTSSVEGFSIAIFDQAKPALTAVVEGFTNFARWATKNVATITTVAVAFGSGGALVLALLAAKLAITGVTVAAGVLGTAFAPVLITLAAVSTAVALIVTNLDKLKAAFGQVKEAGKAVAKLHNVNPFVEQVKGINARLSGTPLPKQKTPQQLQADLLAKASSGQLPGQLEAARLAAMKPKAAVEKASSPKTSGFGSITDVSTGRTATIGTQQKQTQKLQIEIISDKTGLVEAVVSSDQFDVQVEQAIDRNTEDARRATRR